MSPTKLFWHVVVGSIFTLSSWYTGWALDTVYTAWPNKMNWIEWFICWQHIKNWCTIMAILMENWMLASLMNLQVLCHDRFGSADPTIGYCKQLKLIDYNGTSNFDSYFCRNYMNNSLLFCDARRWLSRAKMRSKIIKLSDRLKWVFPICFHWIQWQNIIF